MLADLGILYRHDRVGERVHNRGGGAAAERKARREGSGGWRV